MGGRRGRVVAVAVAVAVALLTGACSDESYPTDERAHRAGIVMGRVRGPATDLVRRVVGDTGEARIEVLVADGERSSGRIVLRIAERRSTGELGAKGEFVACYEYELPHGIYEPHRIDCPDVGVLSLPPPTIGPTIPRGLVGDLEDALNAVPAEQRDAATLETVARRAARNSAVFEVATVGSVVGIAIGNGIEDCVYASVTRDAVEVWAVPDVLARPGELGCVAESAARGAGKTAPH